MLNTTQKNAESSRRLLLFPHESYSIRGACYEIYKQFRNSQKELIYQKALEIELKNRGFNIAREKQLPMYYLNEKIGTYTPDLIVNEIIIIELKAKPFLHKEDVQQFWYYLKNSNFRLGFLVNFGEGDGVKIVRKVYDLARQRSSA